jgi:hypothetical protein
MPNISVRAMAELLNLPAYEQLRILHEQKYPKSQPQNFRTPFYQPSLTAIRHFYQAGRDATVLVGARHNIQGLGLEARRANNLRVLDRFERSNQFNRNLQPQQNPRITVPLGSVELRLSPDLRASEGGDPRVIYYNCRNASIDPDLARTILEIAHWILEQAGTILETRAIEFIDLNAGRNYRGRSRRPRTLTRMRSNVRLIQTLWPTL